MAADISQKKQNFIIRLTDEINAFVDAQMRLTALMNEYNRLNYAVTIVDADLLASSSKHIDKVMLTAGMDTINTLELSMAAAHGTNLNRFRR